MQFKTHCYMVFETRSSKSLHCITILIWAHNDLQPYRSSTSCTSVCWTWRSACLMSLCNLCLFLLCCAGMAAGYTVSDLPHDVQRPISDQRSLRHGARTRTQHWTTSRVWSLRQEVYTKTPSKDSSVDGSWCRWREDLWMQRLFKGL